MIESLPTQAAFDLSRDAAAAGLVVTRLEPLACGVSHESLCFAITLWMADGRLWAEGTHESANTIRQQHIAGYAANVARRHTYRRKAVEVQAIRWRGDNAEAIQDLVGFHCFEVIDEDDRSNLDDPDATASLLESKHSNWVTLVDGDWVVVEDGQIRRVSASDFSEFEPVARPGGDAEPVWEQRLRDLHESTRQDAALAFQHRASGQPAVYAPVVHPRNAEVLAAEFGLVDGEDFHTWPARFQQAQLRALRPGETG